MILKTPDNSFHKPVYILLCENTSAMGLIVLKNWEITYILILFFSGEDT